MTNLSADKPSPLYERRVDPGNQITPQRVNPPSLVARPIPKSANNTLPEKHMPVKR